MDALGREQINTTVSEPGLNLGYLPAGPYFLELEDADGQVFHKRIIKR